MCTFFGSSGGSLKAGGGRMLDISGGDQIIDFKPDSKDLTPQHYINLSSIRSQP